MLKKDRVLAIIVAVSVLSALAVLFGVQVFYAFTQRDYLTEPLQGKKIGSEEYLYNRGTVIITITNPKKSEITFVEEDSSSIVSDDNSLSETNSPQPTTSYSPTPIETNTPIPTKLVSNSVEKVTLLLNGKAIFKLKEGRNEIKVNEGDFVALLNKQNTLYADISYEGVEIAGGLRNLKIMYGITSLGRVK